ncbi:Uncharacterized protein Fot_02317 [Forsythia ovata]|uniref:Protein kinase domain-containing protein n=1 Tax=Forsythia ovata TaxID=205694 RepID=A0ABD1X6H9_9LAMI
MPKPRGTGTYFPKTNQPLHSYTPSAVKGRNQMASRSPRNKIFTGQNMFDRNSHEPSQSEVLVDESVKLRPSDGPRSFSPGGNGHATVNGLVIQPEGGVGFGPVGHVPFGTPFLKSSRQQRPVSSFPQTPSPVSPGMQGPKPAFSMDQDRVTLKSTYHLKDEDDFPPLLAACSFPPLYSLNSSSPKPDSIHSEFYHYRANWRWETYYNGLWIKLCQDIIHEQVNLLPPAAAAGGSRGGEEAKVILFNKYELGRLLGRGAFAKVYCARDVRTDQSVAIKVVNKQWILKGNLKVNITREISIMRWLRHPHIVRLH